MQQIRRPKISIKDENVKVAFTDESYCNTCTIVPLVSDEHDDHVGVGVLPRVLEPRGQVVEGVPPRDVVDEKGAGRASVVRARDGPKRLLAGLRATRERERERNDIIRSLVSDCD